MQQMRLESGLYNSVALDLIYRSGNTDLLTTRTRFRSDYLAKTYHGFVFGSLQKGRKSGEFLYELIASTRYELLKVIRKLIIEYAK